DREKLALQQWNFEEDKELQKWLASHNRETLLFATSALNNHFEEERKLQRELAIYNRSTLLQIADEQRHFALASAEANKLFDNWPLRLVPKQILGRHQSRGIIPLTIFLAPPEVAFDRFRDINSSSGPIKETSLATGLKRFLDTYYPSLSPIRPTELIDGAWDSNRYHGGSSITALFSMLKSEPVLILEMGMESDNIDLRVGYWGCGQEKPWYRVVGSGFSFQSLLNEDPQVVSAALVKILCFVASWFADVHHLTYAERPEDVVPLLPRLLPTLLNEELSRKALEAIIPDFISNYQAVFDALKSEQPYLIPILSLQLVEGLSQLSDQSYARKYLTYSMQNWLEFRGISSVGEDRLLGLILATFDTHNLDYIEMLERCLINLGDNDSEKKLSLVHSYLLDSLFTGIIPDRDGDTLYGC
ncbi:MAG TPA: hypothetical protein VEP90_23050, partial [Methylomirabilota bacterium]|nr:hypothetical protein [Methylomirabilota bacterium]